MADRKSSFFTSLPGTLSALAGLVTAGAAVAAIAFGSNSASAGDKTKSPTPTDEKYTLADWAHDADEICGIVYDNIRALGVLDDPATTWQMLPQLLQVSAQGNERIRALERPKDAADKIGEVLKQAAIAETAARSAYDAWNLGDADTATQHWQAYLDANTAVLQLDTELGATVCARGP